MLNLRYKQLLWKRIVPFITCTQSNIKAMSLWPQPTNPSKQWAERFFLAYTFVWVFFFGVVVLTGVYINWTDVEYLSLGIGLAAPFILYPLIFPSEVDKKLHYGERYWVKVNILLKLNFYNSFIQFFFHFHQANIWVGLFSFVGNYFYTHYFYKVLGAGYTFPVSIQLNEVPFFLYLITHAYFMTYFTLSTILIRCLRTNKAYLKSSNVQKFIANTILIFTMSVITAFMETFTIQSVPYYTHESKEFMYTVGSVFYGWYFYVAFPMFYLIDEKPVRAWTISQTITNCLASCMGILICLDLTRLLLICFEITPTSTVPFL